MDKDIFLKRFHWNMHIQGLEIIYIAFKNNGLPFLETPYGILYTLAFILPSA